VPAEREETDLDPVLRRVVNEFAGAHPDREIDVDLP
jgi:sigma-B regulation protein RsbU (phosphoserine phosphatase)